MTRSKYGPAAGASGGAIPRVTRLRAPAFIRLQQAELDALYNLCGHELCGTLYLILIGGSVFKGPTAGEFLSTYAFLQALLRPPKPERGQWAPAPSLKRVRTALAALEAAGLVHRDTAANAAQGQLRLHLTMRCASKPTAKRVAPGIPAKVREKLAAAREAITRAPTIKGQG